MPAGPPSSPTSIGFLTVAEHAAGLFGGYLLLNLSGRPLEFHCTTPVKPSRAQEILYGSTLAPYLCGELIGQTLVAKASHKPLVVLTDRPAVLALRLHAGMPLALVEQADEEAIQRVDGPHGKLQPALARFRVGANQLSVDPLFHTDQDAIVSRLQTIGDSFDLAEPFARIREAIEEAQRGGS